MEAKSVKIPTISCHHCKATIERELGELEGIKEVKVDVDAKTARIRWDAPASWEQIKKTLTEIGYAPEE